MKYVFLLLHECKLAVNDFTRGLVDNAVFVQDPIMEHYKVIEGLLVNILLIYREYPQTNLWHGNSKFTFLPFIIGRLNMIDGTNHNVYYGRKVHDRSWKTSISEQKRLRHKYEESTTRLS